MLSPSNGPALKTGISTAILSLRMARHVQRFIFFRRTAKDHGIAADQAVIDVIAAGDQCIVKRRDIALALFGPAPRRRGMLEGPAEVRNSSETVKPSAAQLRDRPLLTGFPHPSRPGGIGRDKGPIVALALEYFQIAMALQQRGAIAGPERVDVEDGERCAVGISSLPDSQ